MGYVVTAACVVAKTASDTGEGYFYRDAVLPAGVPLAEKERLVGLGLVQLVEDPDTVPAVVPGEEGSPTDNPVMSPDGQRTVGGERTAAPSTPVKPVEEMSLEELVTYADAHGIDLGKATSEDGVRAKILDAQKSGQPA